MFGGIYLELMSCGEFHVGDRVNYKENGKVESSPNGNYGIIVGIKGHKVIVAVYLK